jgi:hypothetical protein
MPCLAMHLAVAKEYLRHHPEEKEDEFILGTIAPDINMKDIEKYVNGASEDKNSHHFGENYNTTDMIEYMKKKVNFEKFFENNDLDTSFKRAYFLHLICDYVFFGEYITHDSISGMTFDEIKLKGFNDYNRITPILIDKYKLTIPDVISGIVMGHSDGELEIISEQYVYEFIKNMSEVNLEEYKNNILKNRSKKCK